MSDGAGMADRPIGVFDSGLGGLTVLREIRKILPHERVVYFGDCGRAPYGVKSPETIIRFTYQSIRFFTEMGVKLLVIACNTSSAYACGLVSEALDIPVIEVIKPGSAAATRATVNRRIGVVGTAATIESRVYESVINAIDPAVKVFSKACPLFVPIAEEGPYWWGHESTRIIAREYLRGLCDTGIDSLVLGCTHYPLLGDAIRLAIGDGIRLISSAQAVAAETRAVLGRLGILRGAADTADISMGASARAEVSFYTSDSPEKFEPLCSAILGETAAARVHRLDIERYDNRPPK